ncbi:UMP-CMP kinase 2, mitochondrial-like [Macrosteles quadrilineatus]|uniref:UMP-CMP kinase 2, mitochondrial-like n=1 Tax=Macrosteles quadrilineatus TaxID=74068 RepID=UPI0023E30ADE|nr:UMP-CMP kinase 2, mitochondrial-like [Macrosteles quadrilineatus]
MFLQSAVYHTFEKTVFLLWLLFVSGGIVGYKDSPYTRPPFLNLRNVKDLFSLKNLLNEFNSPRISRVPGVAEMIARYNETVSKAFNMSDSLPDHPFIVIESVYNAGRRTVTELVAHALGAVYSTNPPKIMQGFSTAFDGMFLRRKYYALAKYASSNLVKHARKFQPVVMEKYYYDQAIFVIAKTYVDTPLPEAGDEVYKWPSDLTKPDLIFFLNFPDDPTTNLFTQKMVQLFRTMHDPAVIEVDAGHSVHIMANNIIHHINTKLEKEYPLLSDRPREPLL